MGLFDKLKRKKEQVPAQILATQTGQAVTLDKVPDEVFSQKILGDGVCVIPSGNKVFSPASGVVSQVFDTLHAYAITTDDDLDILVHIGVNTVELGGEGFLAHVKEGQAIQAGDLLAETDLAFLQEKGYPTHTMTIVTNSDVLERIMVKEGPVTGGESITAEYEKK